MKVTLYTDDLRDAEVDLVAVGVFSDEPDRGLAFAHLNRGVEGALERACRDEDFRGTIGQTLVFNAGRGSGVRASRVLVYGFGEREHYTAEIARQYAGAASRVAKKVGAKSSAIALTILDAPQQEVAAVSLIVAMTEGAVLGAYSFDQYLTREKRELSLAEVRIAFVAEDVLGVKGATLRQAVLRGQSIAAAVSLARDLVNEPANTLNPAELAERARRIAKEKNLAFKLLGPRDMEKQEMGLFVGVSRGSENEPRLIHLTYTPESPSKDARVIALVGKGLTFDAGGLSLKTSEGMMDMKADMGGGAAVLGTMQAIAELKPNAIVHGIVGAAENMPDGRAIRPGDVLKSKRGLSVEVVNTDAEGRLVLADVLAYAQEQGAKEVIDVATLTNACVVALGRAMGGVFASDEGMAQRIELAWKRSGEAFWRMPLDVALKEQLKSEVADLKNLGDRFGGAITAALFLKEFVGPDVLWAHLDIAGPVLSSKEVGYLAKGATGFGVRTLVEYVTGSLG
jgi:leucyl aminopeptidase